MVSLECRDFIYMWNGCDLKEINDFVQLNGGYVQPGYIHIDEPLETTAFEKMLTIAQAGDTVYVPTIRVFMRRAVDDFAYTLKQLDELGIKVVSLEEPDYACLPYVAAIDVVHHDIMQRYIEAGQRRQRELEAEIAALETQKEDFLRRGGRPQKEIQKIEALALYRTGRFRIDEICEFTGLSKSSLFRALADAEDQDAE